MRDGIYGAIDGAVTTFAVVSGVSGAGLSPTIVIVLGIANLIGDGFSMAAGNFLGTRAQNQLRDKLEAVERRHIQLYHEGEVEELRQIFQGQGFSGKLLDEVVEHVSQNESLWVKIMLEQEYGMSNERLSPFPAATATFLSFLAVGTVPLVPFVGRWLMGDTVSDQIAAHDLFAESALFTAAAFFSVGVLKSKFVKQHWLWSGLETVSVGATAAALAYVCGYLLNQVAS